MEFLWKTLGWIAGAIVVIYTLLWKLADTKPYEAQTNLAICLNKGRSFARAVLPGRLLLWQAERALKIRTRYLSSSEASLAFALYLMSIRSAHGRWIALDYLVTNSQPMNEYSLMSTLANREVLDHLVEGTLTAYGRLPG